MKKLIILSICLLFSIASFPQNYRKPVEYKILVLATWANEGGEYVYFTYDHNYRPWLEIREGAAPAQSKESWPRIGMKLYVKFPNGKIFSSTCKYAYYEEEGWPNMHFCYPLTDAQLNMFIKYGITCKVRVMTRKFYIEGDNKDKDEDSEMMTYADLENFLDDRKEYRQKKQVEKQRRARIQKNPLDGF